MRFLILNDLEADEIRKAARGLLEPRRVDAGEHAGAYVLPARVLKDPDHQDIVLALELLPQAEIDAAAAWPPKEDEAVK